MQKSTFREEVQHFYALQSEIKTLNKHMRKLQNALNAETVTDTVTGSQTEYPYVKHSIPISGINFDEQSNRELEIEIQKTITVLRKRKIELVRQYREIKRFIDNIGDPLLRQILTLHYIENKNWVSVAASIGGNNTENSVKQIASRFFRAP